MIRRWLLAFAIACAVCGVMAGQEASDTAAKQSAAEAKDAKTAIANALQFLRSQQESDGHWAFLREVREAGDTEPKMRPDVSFDLGVTALAALALIENGTPPSDSSVQKAYKYILEKAPLNTRTYNIGLTIMLLTRLGSREDRALVQRLARRLMNGQLDSGGWGYECKVNQTSEMGRGSQRVAPGAGMGDNSNTQFGVMGLWASTRAGVNVEDAIEKVAERFRKSQAPSGGWDYQSTGKADGPAMTTAGVYALTVFEAAMRRKANDSTASSSAAASTASKPATTKPKVAAVSASETATTKATSGKSATDPETAAAPRGTDSEITQKALKRVEQFAAGIGPTTSPYFLWSVERLGVTLGLKQF